MSRRTSKPHKYAPWRRIVLVPYWTLHATIMLIYIGLLSVVLNAVENSPESYGIDEDISMRLKIVTGVWMTLCIITVLLTVAEIVLLVKNKLTPLKFVITNAIKTAIWTCLFIVDIVALAQGGAYGRYGVRSTIALGVAFLISFWCFLLYGIVVLRRSRKISSAAGSGPLFAPVGGAQGAYRPASGNGIDVETYPYQSPVGGSQGRYENFRSGEQHHDRAEMSDNTPMMASPVPNVYVQHHDNHVYEMNARSGLR